MKPRRHQEHYNITVFKLDDDLVLHGIEWQASCYLGPGYHGRGRDPAEATGKLIVFMQINKIMDKRDPL